MTSYVNAEHDERMRVSVIIAAYNVAQQIERALESLRNQTCADWEAIVVDDASTDGTPFAVHRIAEIDRRVRLICQDRNQGPAAARNRGIEAANGEWIAILDADDAWRPERLERLLAVADRAGADYVVDNLILFDDHLQCESGIEFAVRDDVVPFTPTEMFSLDNPWKYGILKPLIRRSVLAEAGLRYNEKLRFGEDLLLTAEVLLRGARGVLTREGYYLYTTPVGHVSRERSSGTRSTTSLESLMWITDFLEEHYGSSFDQVIKAGMARCRERIRQRLVAREITRLRQARSLAALMAYLVGHPRGAVRYLLTSRAWGRAFGQEAAG